MAAQWPPRGLKPWDDALKEYVDEIRSDLEPDVTDNTAARHTHANKDLLDGIPTGGAWYQTLRRGTAGPEWADPAGTVVPTLLVPMQGTLDGWDRSGAITVEGVGALRFRDGGALVEEAGTNLVMNPVFANSASGWQGRVGGSAAREVSVIGGAHALRISGPTSGDGGELRPSNQTNPGVAPSPAPLAAHTLSFDAAVVSGGTDWAIYWREGLSAGGINTVPGPTITISEMSRHHLTYTPTDPTTVSLGALLIRASAVEGAIQVRAVQMEDKPYATTYIDGSLGPGYAWTGTAHASASTRAETSITIPAASFPASLAIRYSEDMGQTWQLATLDDEGAFGNYGVVTYANGDLTFGVSERNVIIGGVRGDERALTDGEKASLLASPVWTWGGLAEGQQGPYTHPATILGTFPPNAQAAVGGATLRTAPGTTAPTIDTLTEGTAVHDTGQRIAESATDYAYVLTAVGQGYVDESDITGL